MESTLLRDTWLVLLTSIKHDSTQKTVVDLLPFDKKLKISSQINRPFIGDAENGRLEFARLKFSAPTRSKMQGWKMREKQTRDLCVWLM